VKVLIAIALSLAVLGNVLGGGSGTFPAYAPGHDPMESK
jgi:hypothetical protein